MVLFIFFFLTRLLLETLLYAQMENIALSRFYTKQNM